MSIRIKQNIIPYLLIILSLSFILFVFYKDYFVFNFSLSGHYKKYYYIGAFLFFISLSTFLINQKILNNLFIIFCTLVLSFQILNLYIYLDGPGRFDDKRLYMERYFDLKEEYPNQKVSVKYGAGWGGGSFVPLSGISNSLTPICNESGEYSIIQTDRYGFNNVDDEWNKPFVHSIFVGDSFTHGACVSENNNIIGEFKKLLNSNKFSVLNLGYLSNGPLLYYATYREYSKNIRPKNVFFVYWEGNDLQNIYEERQVPLLNKYVQEKQFSQNLIERQDEIDKHWEKIQTIHTSDKNIKMRTKSLLVKFLTFYHVRQRLELYERHNKNQIFNDKVNYNVKNDKTIIQLFENVLINFNNEVKEKGGKFYFVYLPDYQRFKLDENKKQKHHKKNEILKILKKNNINLIDISLEFEKLENPYQYWPFEKDGHYNENGYKFVAENLFKYIKK